jgi:hypothetical protein
MLKQLKNWIVGKRNNRGLEEKLTPLKHYLKKNIHKLTDEEIDKTLEDAYQMLIKVYSTRVGMGRTHRRSSEQ